MNFLLLQTGDYLLLQTGDKLLLQLGDVNPGASAAGGGYRKNRIHRIKDDDEEVLRLVQSLWEHL